MAPDRSSEFKESTGATIGAPRTTPFVAVIDGNPHDRKAVVQALSGYYTVSEYKTIGQALAAFRLAPPDLVFVDEMAPPEGGYEFAALCRREPALAGLPVIITTTGDHRVREAVALSGANGHLRKPYRTATLIRATSDALNRRVERSWAALPAPQRAALTETLGVFNDLPAALAKGKPLSFQAVRKSCLPVVKLAIKGDIRTMMDAVKDHDNYTFAHSFKVATMLTLFGKAIGLSESDQLLVASGGLLHDVGKMSIPLHILNKPDRLDAAEWDIMRSHVPLTMRFLEANDDVPRGALIIAGQHHEKIDGSGYPNGLKGAELNELARMATIVDVYGALTDRRVYKPGLEPETAFGIMTGAMGEELDQHLLKLFRETILDAR